MLLFTSSVSAVEHQASDLIIDERTHDDYNSALGTSWRLLTDNVMGGLSRGELSLQRYRGKNCLHMTGDVSTDNNGGFVQIALDLSVDGVLDASAYTGVEIEVAGNDEQYNIHFRTDGMWFPWQSYRASFTASRDWQTYRIPFSSLHKYKTFNAFTADELTRIGIVAIGREFKAELCLASIKFYTE